MGMQEHQCHPYHMQAVCILILHVCNILTMFGTAVQGDIKIGKRLGIGGFGSVYKADLKEDDGTTTPVIVKKVRDGMH